MTRRGGSRVQDRAKPATSREARAATANKAATQACIYKTEVAPVSSQNGSIRASKKLGTTTYVATSAATIQIQLLTWITRSHSHLPFISLVYRARTSNH
jgi:hypothetical protein